MYERVDLSQILMYTTKKELADSALASLDSQNLAAKMFSTQTKVGANSEEIISTASIKAAIDLYPGLVDGTEARPFFNVRDYSIFSKLKSL